MIETVNNELEKLRNDKLNTTQRISQFELELTNLKTHLNMIEGAIQTCEYLISNHQSEEDTEENEESV